MYFRIGFLPFIIVAILTATAPAQPPDTLWTRTFGGAEFDRANSVRQTADGGFVIGGWTSSFGAGGIDLYLIRTDGDGNELWSGTFGTSEDERGYDVQETADGGYVLVGWSDPATGSDEIYLVKTDSSGNMLWTSSPFSGQAYSVQEAADGGYVVAGGYGYGGNVLLVKTDSLGALMWSRSFGEYYESEYANCVRATDDGGYIVAGTMSAYESYLGDFYLIKTNAVGGQEWSGSYGGANHEEGKYAIQTHDGGYAVVGKSYSFGAGFSDIYLVKTDGAGNPSWTQTYGGPSWEEGDCVEQTSDSGYIMVGKTGSNGGGGSDIYLVRTDEQGNEIWSQTYGGNTENDLGYCVQPISDNGYIVAGWTFSYGAGSADCYLIRLAPEENPVQIVLTPAITPLQIPEIGGFFDFTVTVANSGTAPVTFDAWIMVRLPSLSWYGPVLGPLTLTLPVMGALTRRRTQSVPGSAPAGDYLYEARIGDYPDSVWDSDSFPFTKLGTRNQDSGFGEWYNNGENLTNENDEFIIPNSSFIISACPNPFNPTTVLSFDLPVAGQVKLEVFDIKGQRVGGDPPWRIPTRYDAGTHQIPFDGSALPSGIYLARLTAGAWQQTQKLILLK